MVTNRFLNDPYWLDAAKALKENQHTKVGCICSPGRGPSLMINNRPEGYSAWCFRCGQEGGGYVPKRLSVRERLRLLGEQTAADVRAQQSTYLGGTSDVTEWPDEAVQWLLRAGISMEYARKGLRITFNTKLQRLVIPVYDKDGDMVWYNARSFDPNRPKYLSPTKDKGDLVFAPEFRAMPKTPGHTLVLLEDMLSAWKVATCNWHAWSILGTKLTNPVLNRIIDSGPRIVVTWLDPDEAGQTNAVSIRKKLEVYGVETRNIVSERDPKNHDRETITRLIKEVI